MEFPREQNVGFITDCNGFIFFLNTVAKKGFIHKETICIRKFLRKYTKKIEKMFIKKSVCETNYFFALKVITTCTLSHKAFIKHHFRAEKENSEYPWFLN